MFALLTETTAEMVFWRGDVVIFPHPWDFFFIIDVSNIFDTGVKSYRYNSIISNNIPIRLTRRL
jgi:hypothetical protein